MNHTITSDLDALSYETVDRLRGLVVRASALQSEGPEFDSRPGHTKDFKMEPTAVVLGAQHKQWSRENKPVSHNWRKSGGRLDSNQ